MTRSVAVVLVALVALGAAAVVVLRPANGPCEVGAVVTDVRSRSGAEGVGPGGQFEQDAPSFEISVRTDDHQEWSFSLEHAPTEQVGDHVILRCVREGASLFGDGAIRECGMAR